MLYFQLELKIWYYFLNIVFEINELKTSLLIHLIHRLNNTTFEEIDLKNYL